MWRRSGLAPATGALVVLLAGIVTGGAAAMREGPFTALGGASRSAAAVTSAAPLPADRLYPAPSTPPPTRRVVVVPDPAVPEAVPAGEAGAPSGSCWGDDCGGRDGGGDGGGDHGGGG
jgi:hypothetical protein